MTAGYRPPLNTKLNELNDLLSDLCNAPSVLCLDLNQILAEGGALSHRHFLRAFERGRVSGLEERNQDSDSALRSVV
jgi:hypothetical protein